MDAGKRRMAEIVRKNPASMASNPANLITLAFHGAGGFIFRGKSAKTGQAPDSEGPATGSKVRSKKEDVELKATG